jgi:hypothetical protein
MICHCEITVPRFPHGIQIGRIRLIYIHREDIVNLCFIVVILGSRESRSLVPLHHGSHACVVVRLVLPLIVILLIDDRRLQRRIVPSIRPSPSLGHPSLNRRHELVDSGLQLVEFSMLSLVSFVD